MIVEAHRLPVAGEDIELAGWLCRPGSKPASSNPGPGNPLLILCHGIPRARPARPNAENNNDDGGYAALAEQCCSLGIPVFHFNFRGTGESGGNFDLSGWLRDLETVLHYWQQLAPGVEFFLWGFSGGAAVCACTAPDQMLVKGVILAACPATFVPLFPRVNRDEIIDLFREVGIIQDPAFPADPRAWLESIYRLQPAEAVARLAPVPLLILHGADDELIPPDQAEQLFRQAGNPKKLHLLPGASHQLRKHPAAVQAALDWLQDELRAGGFPVP